MRHTACKLSKGITPRFAVLFIVLGFLHIFAIATFGQNNNPGVTQAAVTRYVRALQQRDFKTVIDLSAHYQDEVARIKAANPQVLWPKLINEYYQTKINNLSQKSTGYWQDYGEALGAMIGDPAQGIRAAASLVPPTSSWNISEVRQQTVYVSVNYPAIDDAPIIGSSQILRSAIFQFSTDGRGLIYSIQRVNQGDTLWTGGPDVQLAMAKRFLGAGLWNSAISQLAPLESGNKLGADAKSTLASAYYQHVVNECVTTKSFMSPPVKYRQVSDDAQCSSYVRKALVLNPSLRTTWANKLLSEANFDLQVSASLEEALFAAGSIVKMASEFASGTRELEVSAQKLREDIAFAFVRRAFFYGDHQYGYQRITVAAELAPDIVKSRGAQAAEERLKVFSADVADRRAHGIGSYDNGFFDLLSFMKRAGITIPSAQAQAFLQYANYTNSPDRWRIRVQELVSSTSIATPSSPSLLASSSTFSANGTTPTSPNDVSTKPPGPSSSTDSSTTTLRANIEFARTTAATMPLYNGDWRSVATLTLSNSLSPYNQLYLAAVNRRSIALDRLAAADLFLSKGDTAHAKAYWQKAVYLTLDSENLVHAANNAYSQGVSNTAAVLNAVYRLSSQSAGAVGYLACGTPCYDGIDAVSLLTDYAVDNAIQGKSEADQNLIKNGILKLILDGSGVQKLATTQVTHFVGQPQSVHVIVDQVLGQPQFKAQIMTLLGRTAGYASDSAISAAADSVWQALSTINRNCGNIQVPAPGPSGMKAASVSPVSTNVAVSVPSTLAEPDVAGAVYARTAQGQLIPLERVTARMYTKVTVIKGMRSAGEMEGQHSSVRFRSSDQIIFVVRVSNASDTQKFQLFGFGDGNGKRLVLVSTGTLGGMIGLSAVQLSENVYQLSSSALKPGEYGFSATDSNDAFCFGIDP